MKLEGTRCERPLLRAEVSLRAARRLFAQKEFSMRDIGSHPALNGLELRLLAEKNLQVPASSLVWRLLHVISAQRLLDALSETANQAARVLSAFNVGMIVTSLTNIAHRRVERRGGGCSYLLHTHTHKYMYTLTHSLTHSLTFTTCTCTHNMYTHLYTHVYTHTHSLTHTHNMCTRTHIHSQHVHTHTHNVSTLTTSFSTCKLNGELSATA